jgi:hypothetical protein
MVGRFSRYIPYTGYNHAYQQQNSGHQERLSFRLQELQSLMPLHHGNEAVVCYDMI